jgi:hypothetical protein
MVVPLTSELETDVGDSIQVQLVNIDRKKADVRPQISVIINDGKALIKAKPSFAFGTRRTN